MATSHDIKGFIARWLQLGKGVEHRDGSPAFKPAKILSYHSYSQEFEDWWKEFEKDAREWSLSGTSQPLSELYSNHWEIIDCARCAMPIPMRAAGINNVDCPCHDLPHWPNLELPYPHIPAETQRRSQCMCHRLKS